MLRDPARLEALLAALGDVDELVLLGDVVELRQGPIQDALGAAALVLQAIGEALGAGKRLLLVPGNHDHELLTPWFERRRRAGAPQVLEPAASEVDWLQGEPLAWIADRLAPGFEVRYPGAWLRPDVFATHGHYLDRHTTVPMFERLGAGAMARIVGSAGEVSRGVDGYEAVLAPMYAWIHELAQHGGPQLGRSSHGASGQAWRTLAGGRRRRTLRRRMLIAGFPALIAALNRTPIGPLRADISIAELRRAALRAFADVLENLGVQAQHAIFGHTHRAGPLPGDEPAEWRTDGGVSLINSGCWVHERAFLGSRPAESPYRAGFCVELDDAGPPRLVNILDEAQRIPGVKQTA